MNEQVQCLYVDNLEAELLKADLVWYKQLKLSKMFIYDLNAFEPKWVNHDYILYGVNSLGLGGLHLPSLYSGNINILLVIQARN